MTMRHASGTEIRLAAGPYEARLVSVGAGLAGLTLDGNDLVAPHSVDELPYGYLGKTLMPWPSRIADGAYTWEGTDYQVPVNEPATSTALHGLMSWIDWSVTHTNSDSVTFEAFLAPTYGYPWSLESQVTYSLDEHSGLSVTLRATNVGDTNAPYGVASHPYLTLNNAPNCGYELALPARTVLDLDENLLPVALRPVGELGLDFRAPRLLGDQVVDNAFTDLPDEEWTATLRDPSTGLYVSLAASTPWAQVFTADPFGRHSIAVEPTTCPPNAFNTHEDVIALAPGQSHSMSFRIFGGRS